jgi:hypothetical protein
VILTQSLDWLGLHLAAAVVEDVGPLVLRQVQDVLFYQTSFQQEPRLFGWPASNTLLHRCPQSKLTPMAIEITEADIELVARDLRLELDHPERLAVLKEVTSCDVQAGPGSGKTTILTAKLAIPAKKWPFRDRGVCVLSQTNVARREIERKLSRSAGLRRLLQYPHFVGTLQTFVDLFLAVPFLRWERVEVTAIDDDRFGARAWIMLRQTYAKAPFAIKQFCRGNETRARSIVASLRMDGAHNRGHQ